MRCWCVAVFLTFVVLAGGTVSAPSKSAEPPASQHIWLPPQFGATPESTVIFAQASYVAAVGDYLESAAIARRHNALAAEQEMRNAVTWVSTYFERRELNRAYRMQEHPPFLDQEERRQEQYRRRIDKNLQLSAEGNVTDELNWMLRELAGMSMAYQLMPGPQSLVGTPVDQELEPGDAHHIRLTDGGHVGGKALVFRADAADPASTRWPRALRAPQFDAPRRDFEEARKAAAQEISKTGTLSHDNEERLMATVDALSAIFNSVYPAKESASTPAKYLVYLGGKRYLQSLAGGVLRLLETNDARVFDGSYKFTGESVVELIHHLCRYGLEFAPPEEGDEGTYKKLFFAMRAIYESMAPEAEDKK